MKDKTRRDELLEIAVRIFVASIRSGDTHFLGSKESAFMALALVSEVDRIIEEENRDRPSEA